MNYKIQFEKNIKKMEEFISKAKQAYKSFLYKEDFADDFSYILQYEVVITEYKKYNRDTLNEVILSRMQDDVDELECQIEGFIEELEEYEPAEESEYNDTIQKLSIISNVFSKKEESENLDSYEPYQYEEEELEEDDYYHEDID